MSEAKWEFSSVRAPIEYHVGVDLSTGCLFVIRDGTRVLTMSPFQSLDVGKLLVHFAPKTKGEQT